MVGPGSGHPRCLEAGDLPHAGRETLVDAGVAERSRDRSAVVGAFDLGTGGDNGDGTNQLNLGSRPGRDE